jgi:hypothetical protein
MTRGRLQVVAVPWMVSPSVPEMRISIVENGHTRVALDVAILPSRPDEEPGLVNRGVEIHFEHGQWVRTQPAASDTDPLPPDLFDRSAVAFGDVGDDIDGWMRRFRAEWEREGTCPDPRFYEVLESHWLVEEKAHRFGCRHFALVGHDLWMEVLCKSFEWHWITPAAEGIDPSNLTRGPVKDF